MAKKTAIKLHAIKKESMEVTVIGDSPLIVHAFAAKSLGEMFSKHVNAAWEKTPKDPAMDYDVATYWIDENGEEMGDIPSLSLIVDGQIPEYVQQGIDRIEKLRKVKNPRFGFPAVGFKACAIRGGKPLGMVMTDMRGAFHIAREFVEIHGERTMRNDMTRNSGGNPDVRFRPEWKTWWAVLPVTYSPNVVSAEAVLNMLNMGGFGCGVGDWRPNKGGSCGMFHVATPAEIKTLKK